ncbi:MAG: 50S ribosomal protein L18 [Nitrospiraceae bacterium]|nr:50S ribosomal protein L18 [Nitrospiraceae bacterium]MDA8325979.1 50S ribosomal protein L18 [Nitrospiraceae bacterium]
MAVKTVEAHERRHKRVRDKVKGTAQRPRLSVRRSLKYLYAQLIDDSAGNTLVAASSIEKGLAHEGNRGSKAAARKVGALLAERAAGKGIKKVVFDRSGYRYHGAVKELADGAREGGLEF